jgi:hypothetical protein
MIEQDSRNPFKAFVKVECIYYPDGRPPEPSRFWWEDGRCFEIDKIIDIRRAASLKAGGIGIRYTCRIKNHETKIWFDDTDRQWFMERKQA